MSAIDEFVAQLRHRVTGRVLRPGADAYAQLATPWNIANVSSPAAVVEVQSAPDVAATIRLAADHHLDVSVQSTGHGAPPASQHHGRPTVMVHTGRLDGLSIDDQGVAHVGAGVVWQTLLDAGASRGLAGLAGSAPGVGVVGHVTGGGIGPVSRTFGYASDSVLAFDVVTGDGVIRRVSVRENPDLFWGLRGGKGALGVVTAVDLQLLPLAEIFGGGLYFAAADIESVARAWRSWSLTLPEQASTSFAILRLPPLPMVPPPLAGRVSAAVRYAWVGDPEVGKAVFAPMAAVAPAVLGEVSVMPYASLGSIHADPVDPMPIHEASTLLRELPITALETFLDHTGPRSSSTQLIAELRLMGGALASRPQIPCAVSHRDAAVNVLTIGSAAPPEIARTQSHADELLAALGPWRAGRLPNFGGSATRTSVAEAYDRPTLERLRSLVATYDPFGVLAAGRPFRG